MVADERPNDDPKVRRRMARGSRNRKAGPELDDPDGQGSIGDGAVPVGKRRKSPFPPPTETSETLFQENLGLARKVAWSWARKTGMPYDDIEQIAMMGLLRGCRKYDATKINPGSGKSYALSTYVVPYAHGELLHWYRDNPYAIRFPPKWREQYGKVHRMLGQSAPLEDISTATGLSVEELGEMVERMVTPAELNCEVVGSHDITAELDLASPLGELVDLAYDDLAATDRALLEAWILKPKGPFPHGPYAAVRPPPGPRALRSPAHRAAPAHPHQHPRGEGTTATADRTAAAKAASGQWADRSVRLIPFRLAT
jgi:hypothetical protein